MISTILFSARGKTIIRIQKEEIKWSLWEINPKESEKLLELICIRMSVHKDGTLKFVVFL